DVYGVKRRVVVHPVIAEGRTWTRCRTPRHGERQHKSNGQEHQLADPNSFHCHDSGPPGRALRVPGHGRKTHGEVAPTVPPLPFKSNLSSHAGPRLFGSDRPAAPVQEQSFFDPGTEPAQGTLY